MSNLNHSLRYRLPTEAEWEYAARGGNKSSGYVFSGSNDAGNVAWCGRYTRAMTYEVGTKAPNELGIYDMSSNVSEWYNDCFSATYYSESPLKDPQVPSSGSRKVLRGGSWVHRCYGSRVAFRNFIPPRSINNTYGFRVVRIIN